MHGCDNAWHVQPLIKQRCFKKLIPLSPISQILQGILWSSRSSRSKTKLDVSKMISGFWILRLFKAKLRKIQINRALFPPPGARVDVELHLFGSMIEASETSAISCFHWLCNFNKGINYGKNTSKSRALGRLARPRRIHTTLAKGNRESQVIECNNAISWKSKGSAVFLRWSSPFP